MQLERYWYWGIAQYFPILGSIGYWVILLLAVITQYQYCLDILIPVASREIGEDVK